MRGIGAAWLLVVALVTAWACGGCAMAGEAEARPAAGAHVQGGDWFVQSGCTACHSVTVYGIWTLGSTAPDLSLAVEDVPRRFGVSLDDFLKAPTGTMALVLSTRILLDGGGRQVAIAKLKEAYALHQRPALATLPVSSH